jgi:hypothetical protein
MLGFSDPFIAADYGIAQISGTQVDFCLLAIASRAGLGYLK